MKTRFKCIKRHKKNAEIIKNKRNPRQKELLNLFNDLLYTILTTKTLKLESLKNGNENEIEKMKMKMTKHLCNQKMILKMKIKITKH